MNTRRHLVPGPDRVHGDASRPSAPRSEATDSTAQAALTKALHARAAARALATATTADKIEALQAIADALLSNADAILSANARDVEVAIAEGLAKPLADRLRLSREKIEAMASQIYAVAAQDDPVGRVLRATELDDGLILRQVRCPLGVILAIVEARPDAVTQIAALAIKSGNALLLKSGSEARETSKIVVEVLHDALRRRSTVPPPVVTLIDGRAAIDALLEREDLIDLVVPRGSTAMVRSIMTRTHIPVLGHAAGVCHIYIDEAADVGMAIDIVADAKIQYPAACNAVEAVLVHQKAAPQVLKPLVQRLTTAGVEVRGCAGTQSHLADRSVQPTTSDDWGHEYGDLTLAIRIVEHIDEALAHIAQYGSGHTEGIITSDDQAAAYFLARVDAAGVFHNASTRFADGYRYGLGAEVGISTGKLHARGPVGLDGLTTYKYLLSGRGHVVAPYVGASARPFRHITLPAG